MSKKHAWAWLSLLFVICFIAGCAGEQSNNIAQEPSQPASEQTEKQPQKDAEQPSSEPVSEAQAVLEAEHPAEFVILTPSSTSEQDFEQYTHRFLREKFPEVNFVQLQLGTDGLTYDTMIAFNIAVDLIESGITNVNAMITRNIPIDIEPLIRKHNDDLSRIDASMIESIRGYSANEEILIFPTQYQPFVLHYNKDIFDRFGVEYPKAGSTWNELIDLARRLTKFEDGIQYRGLDAGLNINRMYMQLSLPFVDEETGKSVINSHPGWKKMFQTYQDIYSIPGNLPVRQNGRVQLGASTPLFLEDQIIAMFPHLISIAYEAFRKPIEEGMNMGISTFPVFEENPKRSTGFFGQGYSIPVNSRDPDFAFKVLEHLTSDEVQLEYARMGIATPLANEAVQAALFEGNEIAEMVGLDVSLVYALEIAPPAKSSYWDAQAVGVVNAKLNELVRGELDVNTALRLADEEINSIIEANPKPE